MGPDFPSPQRPSHSSGANFGGMRHCRYLSGRCSPAGTCTPRCCALRWVRARGRQFAAFPVLGRGQSFGAANKAQNPLSKNCIYLEG